MLSERLDYGSMGGDLRVETLVEVMRACGDETRIRLLNLLHFEKELCVYDMVEVTGASQPKISRHLAHLRRAGLVSYRKDGLWVYYRIIDQPDGATELVLDALERSFRLLPDLGHDLMELQRIKALSEVTRWHQRPPPSLAAAPSPAAGVSQPSETTSTHRSVHDLEIELL